MDKNLVYIVGVGPGDAGLVTLRANQVLKKADVIVYDRLVSSQVMKLANPNATLIYVGKKPDFHPVPQSEINKILIEEAKRGKCVARIKGGDPFVFGRGGEEIEALIQAGIKFEVVPGITSSIAAPAYAGIPVTYRDKSPSFHVFTAHFKAGEPDEILDFKTIAQLSGTLIFLMGVKNLPKIVKGLVDNGMPSNTAIAIVERGTTPYQRHIVGSLKTIVDKAKAHTIIPPSIIVVGKVVEREVLFNWFENRPLHNKTIVVTRARAQASQLCMSLQQLGANVLEMPTISILAQDIDKAYQDTLKGIKAYTWLIFTSVNGFEYFKKALKISRIDIRTLNGIKICAIGSATKKVIEDAGMWVDLVPPTYITEDVIRTIVPALNEGDTLLHIKGDLASNQIAQSLNAFGYTCDECVTYKTKAHLPDQAVLQDALDTIDLITFTSASTVKNFSDVLDATTLSKVQTIACVCIGPKTEEAARQWGYNKRYSSEVYTIESMIAKVRSVLGEEREN